MKKLFRKWFGGNSSTDQCDTAVFRRGSHIFLTHSLRSAEIEEWVKAAAKLSGTRMDWHWVGGRANVLCIGDTKKARKALWDLRHMHDTAYAAQWGYMHGDDLPRRLQGIWDYNNFPSLGGTFNG